MLRTLLYPVYVMTHPFDGFYDMKHEHKGKTRVAILYVLLFWVAYSMNKQYAGFVVNKLNPMTLNTFFDFVAIVALFLLFTTANWSITSLLDGEGRFKDITMATAYAMTPLILTYLPATLIGNYVARNEETFYYLFIGLGVVWFLLLLFIGIMTVQGYGMFKTVLTFILTLLAMLVIVFLLLLMMTLIQQVWMFLVSIYRELIYRV